VRVSKAEHPLAELNAVKQIGFAIAADLAARKIYGAKNLSQQFTNDLCWLDAGEALVQSLKGKDEAAIVDAHAV